MISGCGAPQNGGGTIPQTTANDRSATHWVAGKSWLFPGAKRHDLLYTSDDDAHVLVYSYPGLTLVGVLGGFGDVSTQGLCVDAKGDVFVPAGAPYDVGYVYEFAHGAIYPMTTLDDPGWGAGCSVDPKTGNLAVANYFSPDPPYDHGNVAIYAKARGTPRTYTSPYINWYDVAAYDDKGDLFVDGNGYGGSGFPLAELPAGGDTFADVTLNETITPYSLQWDRGNLIIASYGGPDAESIYRVAMSGNQGTIVGTTTLRIRGVGYGGNGQFWIEGDRIIGPGHKHRALDLWRYPAGGRARSIITKAFSPWGVVVSAR
jgi:hypothetical protein